jgi:transposase
LSEERKTMTVPQMRKILGLKKTESYWLVHRNFFQTDIVNGHMMIDVESFEKWYANQVKHRKVDGPEPGAELTRMSYSFAEVAEMLGVSGAVVYEIWDKNNLETFTVDFVKRIPKEVFEKWYAGQTRYRKRKHGSHVGAKRSRYISRDEAAVMAGVTPSTVSRWADEGYFRFTKTDKILRIRRDSFERWLDVRKG